MQASSKGKTSRELGLSKNGVPMGTPEILWFMIVFTIIIPMFGQTQFSPEHIGIVCKITRQNRAHVNMLKGFTSPLFAASV